MTILFSKIKTCPQRGFTLIELLVSVALFSIVMSISIGTLLSLVDANRKAQSMRSVTDNLHFALDSMARNIRTGYNYACNVGCTTFAFIDDEGRAVTYKYVPQQNRIMRRIGPVSVPEEQLTAPEVNITDMRFYISGENSGDNLQPTVTIVIQGTAGNDPDTESSFAVQTTVTQRLLDI